MARYVKLTINSNWGGMNSVVSLSEVRFSYVPVQARAPQPANGATGVALDTNLDWRVGREVGSHQVFLSTDPAAVAAGTARQDGSRSRIHARQPELRHNLLLEGR